MTSYVCGFMFSEDRNKLALISKLSPEWQKGKLNGIGGKIEPREGYLNAMVREFKEETGVNTFLDEWKNLAYLQGKDWEVYFFKAFSNKVYNAVTVTEEEVVLVYPGWINILPVIPNLLWLIPMALDKDRYYADICYLGE